MKRGLLIGLIVYLLSAGGSFWAFRTLASPAVNNDAPSTDESAGNETELGALLQIDPSEPKDQACPLNGQLYTTKEKAAWETRRPMAVMIENSEDARPQSGLSQSDVVFEAVAEGGITRFMALFYCDVQRNDTVLAPVRSARSYYVDWASGFNLPLYVHVGGANLPGPANALGQIGDYGWNQQNDLNQFSIGYPTFVRNANRIPGKEIATEHTMETSTERIWAVGEKRGWTNVTPAHRSGGKLIPEGEWKAGYTGWTFAEPTAAKGTVSAISYEFWTGYKAYAISWQYDATTNSYKRTMGGTPHIDMNNEKQLAAKNVVVMLTDEKGPIDEAKHMLYTTTGTGKALIFKNGEAIEAKWSKKTRESELEFLDAKGKDVELVPGQVWISTLAKNAQVTY
jgi:hypothetical protein